MGNQTSHQTGTLPGPSSTLPSNTILPRSPVKKRVFAVMFPLGKTNGGKLEVKIDRVVTIPSIAKTNLRQPIRPGETFDYELSSNIDHIFVSTLPLVPGMEIIQSKPIVFASVTHSFVYQVNENDRLMKDFSAVHEALVRQAHAVGANVVLSVQFQTNTDHTPCIVGPSLVATATESCSPHYIEATSNSIMPATHA
jgi:uncharacterized protein YbjQ (UPF0145 family)